MLLLLIFALLGACCATPVTPTCSEDEIMKHITDFNRKVEEMQSPHVNLEQKLDEISILNEQSSDYYDAATSTCADKNANILEILNSFLKDTNEMKVFSMRYSILGGNTDKFIENFEKLGSEQIRFYTLAHVYAEAKNFDEIINALKLEQNGMNIIIEIQEGLIYLLNDNNIHLGKSLVSYMDEFIALHEESIVVYAKKNLKKLVERSVHAYPDALVLLNEVDSEMAGQIVRKYVRDTFTNSVFSKAFSIVNNAPTVHLKALALYTLNEKIHSMYLHDTFVTSKVYGLAKLLIENENINDKADFNILNDIVYSASQFSTALASSYTCQSIKDAKSSTADDGVKQAEYVLYQDIEYLDQKSHLLKLEEDGSMLKLDLQIEGQEDNMKYSILLLAHEYSEPNNLPIISKKRYSFVSLTNEEICELSSQPEYNACIPTINTYDEDPLRKKFYNVLNNYRGPCNSE